MNPIVPDAAKAVACAREEWFERLLDLAPGRLVFIDETSVSTNMARRFGRAPRALPSVGPIRALGDNDARRGAAPRSHRRAHDDRRRARRGSFLAYIAQVLAPTFCAGEIVVMDNVRTHKVAGVREAIEAKGAKVPYLPPYSPDFNPIEKSFARSRRARRGADRRCASDGGRRSATKLHAERVLNYFAASDYDAA